MLLCGAVGRQWCGGGVPGVFQLDGVHEDVWWCGEEEQGVVELEEGPRGERCMERWGSSPSCGVLETKKLLPDDGETSLSFHGGGPLVSELGEGNWILEDGVLEQGSEALVDSGEALADGGALVGGGGALDDCKAVGGEALVSWVNAVLGGMAGCDDFWVGTQGLVWDCEELELLCECEWELGCDVMAGKW